MDHFRKRIPKEIIEMEKQLGRMMRNLSLSRMVPYGAGNDWLPATDIYETENELLICMDLAGIRPADVEVTAETRRVVVSGVRRFPIIDNPSCIHQFEIEHGAFERIISLPVAVDVSATSSEYKDGLLVIKLPKPQPRGKINVKVG